MIKYSIVIPCYSSGTWLKDLVKRISDVMVVYKPFELILVNDRSPDNETWAAIVELASRYDFVRGIDLLYNVGQFRATLCGLENAVGQYVITMDDDFQHPPEEIPKLIQAILQNPLMDCIMGKYSTKQHNLVRNVGSFLLRKIMNHLYNKHSDIVTTSFRIMPTSFAKTLILYRITFPQLGPLIVSLSKRIKNVPIEHHNRKVGTSGYNLIRGIKETYRSVLNASIIPLRIFSVLGFVTAGVAFFTGIFFFWRWIVGGIGVPGFTSLILAISFFSGMFLAGIGVLGEYIGRIIQEITGMPRYEVRLKVGGVHDTDS